MDQDLRWTCRSCLAHRACGVMVSRLSGWHWSGHFRRPSSCGIRRAEGETGAGRRALVWNFILQPSARPQGVPVGPQSTRHAPDRGACALRIALPLGLTKRCEIFSKPRAALRCASERSAHLSSDFQAASTAASIESTPANTWR
eukprot:scaffold9513_cov84-Phaeocystis_antarctica.AAC.1